MVDAILVFVWPALGVDEVKARVLRVDLSGRDVEEIEDFAREKSDGFCIKDRVLLKSLGSSGADMAGRSEVEGLEDDGAGRC